MQQADPQADPHSPARRLPLPGSGHAPLLLAMIVFLVTLVATYSAWDSARRSAQEQLRETFDYRTRDMAYSIERRMAVYEQVLRGARGYLRGSVALSRAEFAEYYRTLRLDQYFPGLEAIGIATAIPPGGLAAHERGVRAEGFPHYAVSPDTPRDTYTAIAHIEPFSGRNLRAFGYDMFSEPVRRAAMIAARDSGQAALSGKVVLVQEGKGGVQSGVLMYLPVYRSGMPAATVEQRRAALAGWVYAPFRMNDLMSGVSGIAVPQLEIAVYDGPQAAPDALLYRSPVTRGGPAPFQSARRLDLGGRTWLVTMRPDASLLATLDATRPLLIALTGTTLGFLLALVVWLLATERRRALQLAQGMTHELRASHDRIAAEQQRIRVILENAYDGFVAVDEDGRITDWNAQATRIFGLAANEAVGRPVETLLPEPRRAAFRAAFESFKRGGPCSLLGAPAEVEVLHAGGRLVPAELAVALPPNGKVDGASVFVRDITPRREAEAREQQRQQRLDEAREGLARAQKLEAVGKLTGGVAHDFNNILHIISANVQLMLRAEGPMNKKRLHSILDAVDRGAKLAGQLLAFARRQPLHPTVVDVSQLLERVDSLLLRAAGDSVTVERSAPPDLWPTLVDPNQLENVLLNLVINARDAMDGAGTIALRLANVTVDSEAAQAGPALADPELTPGDYVQVAVSDTGQGMPREVMERAFEPFFTTKPEGKGTGLGLSMAHGFVRQSGGHIRLASTPGQGTTVTIYLPRHVAPALRGAAGVEAEAGVPS